MGVISQSPSVEFRNLILCGLCFLQILRSIDSDSADGFPSHQQEAMQMGLDSGKGKIIEYSIQKVLHFE